MNRREMNIKIFENTKHMMKKDIFLLNVTSSSAE